MTKVDPSRRRPKASGGANAAKPRPKASGKANATKNPPRRTRERMGPTANVKRGGPTRPKVPKSYPTKKTGK